MRTPANTLLLAWLTIASAMAQADLKLAPQGDPVCVFGGQACSFPVIWRNSGDAMAVAQVRMRLLQASSDTIAPIGEWPWKQLQVLAGQSVLESAAVDFPEVQAETRFLLQWLGNTHQIFGTTDILVYPTNLLSELASLAGDDQAVGILDPGDVLKPALKLAGVEFDELESSGMDNFRGKLAVIGPFASRGQMPGLLAEHIKILARKGVGVVWLLPPPGPRGKLQPSFRTVLFGTGAIIVVQPQLVTELANNPQAQLNLLRFCRLARQPEPAALPEFTNQP